MITGPADPTPTLPAGAGALRGLPLAPDPPAPVSAASPPRCAVLDCTHVCNIDYTVVLGLGDLLGDFHRHGVTLAFVGLQVGVATGGPFRPQTCP